MKHNHPHNYPVYPVYPAWDIGDLMGVPLRIVQEMMAEQKRQGNEPDHFVFANNISADRACGGFDWAASQRGIMFWDTVING